MTHAERHLVEGLALVKEVCEGWGELKEDQMFDSIDKEQIKEAMSRLMDLAGSRPCSLRLDLWAWGSFADEAPDTETKYQAAVKKRSSPDEGEWEISANHITPVAAVEELETKLRGGRDA